MRYTDNEILDIMETKSSVDTNKILYLTKKMTDWEDLVPSRHHKFVYDIIEGMGLRQISHKYEYDGFGMSMILLKIYCYLEGEYIYRNKRGKEYLSKLKSKDDYNINFSTRISKKKKVEKSTAVVSKIDKDRIKEVIKKKETVQLSSTDDFVIESLELRSLMNKVENWEKEYFGIIDKDIQQQIVLLLNWGHTPKSIYEGLNIGREEFYNLTFKKDNDSIFDKITKAI